MRSARFTPLQASDRVYLHISFYFLLIYWASLLLQTMIVKAIFKLFTIRCNSQNATKRHLSFLIDAKELQRNTIFKKSLPWKIRKVLLFYWIVRGCRLLIHLKNLFFCQFRFRDLFHIDNFVTLQKFLWHFGASSYTKVHRPFAFVWLVCQMDSSTGIRYWYAESDSA